MAERPISLDTDEAAAAVASWRAYSDRVELHGATDPSVIAQLRLTLGDTYADFVDAKVAELEQRAGAYRRVAAQSRLHADKLERTSTQFEAVDAANATPLNRIAVD
jgi:hypothetical protein